MHNIFLVDDDESIRNVLRDVLTLHGYGVQCFATAEQLLQSNDLVRGWTSEVCCVVSDVKMPGVGGIGLMRQLLERKQIGIVLMSGASSLQDVIDAFHGGATQFLLKPIELTEFLAAVRKAIQTAELWLASDTAARSFREAMQRLSAQERRVILHVSQGKLNREIAEELGIALRTVKLHRHRAIEKLGVESVPELVRMLDAAS